MMATSTPPSLVRVRMLVGSRQPSSSWYGTGPGPPCPAPLASRKSMEWPSVTAISAPSGDQAVLGDEFHPGRQIQRPGQLAVHRDDRGRASELDHQLTTAGSESGRPDRPEVG